MSAYVGCLESADFFRDIMIRSINENLSHIIHPINLPSEAINTIGKILISHITPKSQGSIQEAFKKTPKDLGDSIGSQGDFNIIPSLNTTSHITDTLVVFCLGNDNLNNRLVEMIINADNHHFKNVIFITSKWDISSLTGKNILNLQNLVRLRHTGVVFRFILLSTYGIGEVCVL